MTTNTNNEAKMIELLAKWTGEDADSITQERSDTWGLCTFQVGSDTYAVGTDDECQAACAAYIEDSVWAFNARFLLEACDLPMELDEAIAAFQRKECEGANEALLRLVKTTCGLEALVRKAIGADGRGHFLASYDGEEIYLHPYEEGIEGEGFFAYRIA